MVHQLRMFAFLRVSAAMTRKWTSKTIRCINCKYNLNGLRPSSRCPECGAHISDSRRAYRTARRSYPHLNRTLVRLSLGGVSCSLLAISFWAMECALFLIPTLLAMMLLAYGTLEMTSSYMSIRLAGALNLNRRLLCALAIFVIAYVPVIVFSCVWVVYWVAAVFDD